MSALQVAGMIGFLLSFFLGLAPMLVFAWVIYWLDRFEKEPLLLIGGVFLWGAIGAASAAFLINTIFGLGVYLFTSSTSATDLATGTLIAPIVEEVLKGLAVLTVFLLAHNEFDSFMDGIVYAGVVALGFAATENVYYIYSHGFLEGSYGALLWVAFVRICLVGWQHPFYSAFFGIGLAISRMYRTPAARVLAPLGGLGVAMLFHSLHNTIGSFIHGLGGLVAEAAFDWSGWSLMFLFILWATARERGWIVKHLCEEVDLGLISFAQYETACSAWSQSIARFTALLNGRYRATNRFYQICGELAQKKHQRQTLGEEGHNSQIIERLQLELGHLAHFALA
jgi:RsiW-degrading membrane proteinase PrsW (M82 family)